MRISWGLVPVGVLASVFAVAMTAHAQGITDMKKGEGGSAIQGSAYISNYAASKAYNLILGEGLWEELRAQGVDVVVCAPGLVDSPEEQRKAMEEVGRTQVAATPPRQIVADTLRGLGKRPLVIPGWSYRLAAFAMGRLIPRAAAVRLMGRMMRNMQP